MRRTRGLYRRGNVWWISYILPDGENNKTVRESAHTSNMKEAEELLSKRRQAAKDGKNPEPAKPTRSHTFNELVVEYLDWAKRQRYFKTKKYIVKYLIEKFGNRPLNSFDTLLLEKYQTELISKVKPATVNRYIACLKHMLNKAYEWNKADNIWVKEDVLISIKRVKPLEENNQRKRYLSSQEEIHALLEACSPHLKPIVITALNTGMRMGEILGLKWEQIDLRNGLIFLTKTKNGKPRGVPINATLREVFKSIPHSLESEYVFTDRNGRPYKSVNNSFPTACRRAGIRDFHFHDLRHTFASYLVMARVDLRSVQELLGHKDLRMTVRYSHLDAPHLAKAVGVLEERLKIPSTKNTSVLHNYFTV